MIECLRFSGYIIFRPAFIRCLFKHGHCCSCNEKPVVSVDSLQKLLDEPTIDKTIEMGILRKGRQQTIRPRPGGLSV